MQIISPALQAHLEQEVTTLATCWKITRRDGVILRFSDHDTDLVVAGETYLAASGITPSAITSQAGLAVDNLELEGLLNSDSITQDDVLSGRFDHAEITTFLVNAQDTVAGMLHLKTGWLGEVRLQGGMFTAEVRGVSAMLQQTIGEVYTHGCRARLGDARCGLDLEALTVTGTITAVEGRHAFSDGGRGEESGYFAYGTIRFTSGANEGLSMEIREFRDGRFGLFLPMPKEVEAGDAYVAVAGCDKRFDTCVVRFDNALNFRGEPHVPGTDKIMETAATRST